MLTYDNLSVAQKKWVMMVQLFHPEIKEKITFEQVNKFHMEFMKLRKTDSKYKIGLPNWLLTNNRIDKGTYFFPAQGNVHTEVDEPDLPEDDALNQRYVEYLKKFGVIQA